MTESKAQDGTTARDGSTARDASTARDGRQLGRRGPRKQRIDALLLVSALVATLLFGCCPVPTATGGTTSFTAHVTAAGDDGLTVRLAGGQSVRLRLADGTFAEGSEVGQRVYVQGTWEGSVVLVERLIVLTEPA